MGLAPFVDILFECSHQLRLLICPTTALVSCANFCIVCKNLMHELPKSIYRTLIHLSLHAWLCILTFTLILVAISPRLRASIIQWSFITPKVFPKFMSVSTFEIFLIEVLSASCRIIESKWIWNLFVKESSLFDYFWFPLCAIFIAPFEIRFKIYLEEKFRTLAPVVIGILHALATSIMPILYFVGSQCFVGCKLKSIDLTNFGLGIVNYYHLQTSSTHLKIIPVNMIFRNCFLVQGDARHTKGMSVHLVFEAYKFYNLSAFFYLILPLLENMIFAALVIYLDRKLVKTMCSNDIHHICAHLILEEYLCVGLSRYIYSPFTWIDKYLISQHDKKIKDLGYMNTDMLRNYFHFQLHGHANVHPSMIYQFFNGETDIIGRIDTLLSK